VDRVAGVLRATNPQSAAGGVDADSADDLRRNAAARIRTLDRAIALDDLAALAQSYPGIARARATWRARDGGGAALANPSIQLVVATSDLLPLAEHAPPLKPLLRTFLDARRDANVPLQITDAIVVPILVAATLDIDRRFGRNATMAAARVALGLSGRNGGFFDLTRRTFGETIPLSAIYALLQDVPGVSDAVITAFNRSDISGARLSDNVMLQVTEVATIDLQSTLSAGAGGFSDA
jgi:hypothetical protein